MSVSHREPTRRERQREATIAEIVAATRALLVEGQEPSLRAVASRMGMTAPALYRYVASYQELVDLVAYEIDRAATEGFREVAGQAAQDDPAGQLVLGATAFRQWALSSPREFGLVFANPVADPACGRRELLTLSSSGLFFTDLMHQVWERTGFPIPALDELAPSVREAVLDPLIPAETEGIAERDRGLVWVYMQGWTTLYGVVALEVFGHMDPRVIESGEMFVDALLRFAPTLGLSDDTDRLETLIREQLAR